MGVKREKNMLKIEELFVSRGKTLIIDNINLEVSEGEIVGIVGPNGAGKSTLIKACAGVVRKKKGKIICNEMDLDENFEKYLENVQFCYDRAPFYKHLTGFQNLMQLARIYEVSKDEVIKALQLVGLENRKDEKVSKYSFGMKQRLNLAQIVLIKSPFIFLDEPLNGIDPEGVTVFRGVLNKMRDEYGCTLIISSHLLGELKNLCDRIVFIKKGKIVDDIKLSEEKGLHIITTDNIDEALKLLTNKVGVKIFEGKLVIDAQGEEFNKCVEMLVNSHIRILNIESYNDVERVYINKVGGELSE